MTAELRPPGRGDLLLAAALTAAMAAAASATGNAGGLARAGAAVVALGLLALAVRRPRPLAAAVAVAVVVCAETAATPGGTPAPAFLALMVADYSLGAHARARGLAAGLAVSTVAVAIAQISSPSSGYSHTSAITFFTTLLVLAPAAVGGLVRIRTGLARRLTAGTEAMRADAAARLALERTEHRLRIGAEIETVVLSGLEQLRPHATVGDLADVTALRDLGRELLVRLRVLLTRLRDAEGEPESTRSPGHNLAELRTQVDRVLAMGAAAGEPLPARRVSWTLFTEERLDTLLAVAGGAYALLVVAVQLAAPAPPGRRWLLCLVGAATALPAVWIRRQPLAMTATALAAVAVFDRLDPAADPLGGPVAAITLIGLPILVAGTAPTRVALIGLAACLATAATGLLTTTSTRSHWQDLVSSGAVAAGSWAAGRVLRAGAAALRAGAAEAAGEQQRQQERLRLALAADRIDVARELHDAVGHVMTGVVLQATAAARVWESEPGLAAEHVTALKGTVSEALGDLQPLVLNLALEGGGTPGLGAAAGLLDHARACGLRLRVEEEGAAAPLTPEVDAVAYRTLQEALTNAARHAPGADVLVRLAHAPDSVSVQIRNAPPPYPGVERVGSGYGLRGMAERVSGCGGTLRAETTADGGFEVHAVLPRRPGEVQQ